nr:transcriptional regulatory protein AlgP-like [Aegilops tauschii subsp. strangulata]
MANARRVRAERRAVLAVRVAQTAPTGDGAPRRSPSPAANAATGPAAHEQQASSMQPSVRRDGCTTTLSLTPAAASSSHARSGPANAQAALLMARELLRYRPIEDLYEDCSRGAGSRPAPPSPPFPARSLAASVLPPASPAVAAPHAARPDTDPSCRPSALAARLCSLLLFHCRTVQPCPDTCPCCPSSSVLLWPCRSACSQPLHSRTTSLAAGAHLARATPALPPAATPLPPPLLQLAASSRLRWPNLAAASLHRACGHLRRRAGARSALIRVERP